MSLGHLALIPCLLALAPVAQAEPPAYRVYATSESSGELSVIDGNSGRVLQTLALGKRPRGLRVSGDGSRLYVALSGSPLAPPGVDESKLPPPDKSADGIGIVDLRAMRLVKVLRGVSDPEQLVLSTDERRLYVASEDTGELVTMDAASGAVVAKVHVGEEPEGVALAPDGSEVWVTCEGDSTAVAVDTRTGQVRASHAVGERPRGIAFGTGGRAWIAGEQDASVMQLDTRTGRTLVRATLPGGELVRPMGIVLSPAGDRLFVTAGRSGKVFALDANSLAVRSVAEIGGRPWGVGISPDGGKLYTADGSADRVSVINTKTMAPLKKIDIPGRPWGIAVGPALAAAR